MSLLERREPRTLEITREVISQYLPMQNPVSKEAKVSTMISTRKTFCLKDDIVGTSVCSIATADGYENFIELVY